LGVSERAFDGQNRVVVDVMAQLQTCTSPPAVERTAKLRRFVQPLSVSPRANLHR